MDIGYSDKKVQKICENKKEAIKKLGQDVALKMFQRLQWIAKAPNLDFFNTSYKFLRLHKLSGNYDGMYALDINKQYRLIFYPCNEEGEPDTESDFKSISIVTIQEVSKHYE
ncbi:type II toxin-antitoxin system RelE/ParE family toxin [Clostridium celatum]|uniref:Toxin-antitoxin system, toxin component, RelE family n=1 Tax=Clostridium celatum DSM 1785 TaxID=545697 RepID=L1Q7H1_9CLOT|nr:type II toxin-antitoxin system RelE/ParE family toxin [Clostridium celatum]EKY23861.1 toxin-antitoxin system, toxin component, RelE family [Clostridium celatum DSM 1785]